MKRNIIQLKPGDLPEGVITTLGEDPRGRCYLFDHLEYGRLGRLVMINIEENKQKLQYDFFEGNELRDSSNYIMRMNVFKQIVQIINQAFDDNFSIYS